MFVRTSLRLVQAQSGVTATKSQTRSVTTQPHRWNSEELAKQVIAEVGDANKISPKKPYEHAIDELPPTGKPLKRPGVSSFTLENGLRVITTDMPVPGVSISLFKQLGPRFETSKSYGSSHYLKHLYLRDNGWRFNIETARHLEVAGADITVSYDREHFHHQFKGVNKNSVTDLGMEFVRNTWAPGIQNWDANETRKLVKEEVASANSDPQHVVIDAVHAKAFRGSTLGNSLYCPNYKLNNTDDDVVYSYLHGMQSPERMVLVTSCFDVEKATEMANSYYNMPKCDVVAPEPAKYQGGEESLIRADYNGTHAAIVWAGETLASKDVVAQTVLSAVLGHYGPLSWENAVGSGVSGRMQKFVRGDDAIVRGKVLNLPYSDAGLFGIVAEGTKDTANELVDKLFAQATALKSVTEKELATAKGVAKGRALAALDDPAEFTKFLGEQALYNATALTPQDYIKAVDAVTLADVNRVSKKIFSSKPTVAVSGNVENYTKHF